MRAVVRRAIDAADRAEWQAEEAAERQSKQRHRAAAKAMTAPGSFKAFEDLTRQLVQMPKRVSITTSDSPVQINVPADSALAEMLR